MRATTVSFVQPNRPLSINEHNRMHWAARRRRIEPWRLALRAELRRPEIRDCLVGVSVPIVVDVALTFSRNGRRDPHNYVSTVVKALVDELVAEGIVTDDTADWVKVNEPTLRISSDTVCLVTITREVL